MSNAAAPASYTRMRGGLYVRSSLRMEQPTEARDLYEMRRVSPTEEIRVLEGDGEGKTLIIAGYAALFDSWTDVFVDWWGFREVIRPGAFTKTLQEGADVRDLRNHLADKVVSRVSAGNLKVWEDPKGLRYESEADQEISYVGDLIRSIRARVITQNSFAFWPVKDRWTFNSGNEPDERELLEVKLIDVSQVTFPAYEDTTLWLDSRSLDQISRAALAGNAHARQLMQRLDTGLGDSRSVFEPGSATHSGEPEPQEPHSAEPNAASHSDEPGPQAPHSGPTDERNGMDEVLMAIYARELAMRERRTRIGGTR